MRTRVKRQDDDSVRVAVHIPAPSADTLRWRFRAVGTFITNPVTIFFIYPAQTYVVNRMLFGGSLSFSRLMQTEWTWHAVRRLGAEAMASFFLGGLLLAIILTPITYFTVRGFVVRSRRRKMQSS